MVAEMVAGSAILTWNFFLRHVAAVSASRIG